MIDPKLKNRPADMVSWLDGVGAPSTAATGAAGVLRIRPIDDGVLIERSPSTTLIPWARIISVVYDGELPI